MPRTTLAALSALFVAGTALAQWVGPTGSAQRIDYTGNVFVGNAPFYNSVIRSDVADDASNGRVISFHAFAGTPSNAVRTTAIWGETNNPAGRALQGFNFASTGAGAGIWAETASTAGMGLRARATAATGSSFASYYDNASTAGIGVYSLCTANSGTPIAIYGDCLSASGYSAYFTGGRNYFQGNVGIGSPTPTNPLAVIGTSSSGSIYAENSSTLGGTFRGGAAGVYGNMTSTSAGAFAAGVWGVNHASTNQGVGVAGYHAGSGFGIYGAVENTTAGYAGAFDGNVILTGLISKGGGSFKIDHPLDPENKYLYHSFVESPDMMNIYNGTVTTDAEGYATVTMPDWFDALNRDFRYQLTVIDESAPDLFTVRIARKLSNNQFSIKTVPGNLEVSWQVTGIRHDAFANQHRIAAEVDKEQQNKGRYLHPEAFGKPRSLGIFSPGSATAPAASSAPHALPPATTSPADAARKEPPLKPAIYGGR